jgi:hypothetical protein
LPNDALEELLANIDITEGGVFVPSLDITEGGVFVPWVQRHCL